MPELTTIEAPDTDVVVQQSFDAIRRAGALEIVSATDYEAGAECLRVLKLIRAEIAGTFKDPVAKAYAAHKAMKAAQNKHDVPVAAAYAALNAKMGAWTAEQDRIRREKEDALRKAELARAEEQRLAEAAKLEDAGKQEAADALIEAPVQPAPVHVPSEVPKVAGVSVTTYWKFRIVDAKLVPRGWCTPDEKAIGAYVRHMKGQVTIPGVEVYSEDSTSVRA